jgi:hypothetical protein
MHLPKVENLALSLSMISLKTFQGQKQPNLLFKSASEGEKSLKR